MDRFRFGKITVVIMVALLAVIIFCAAALTALDFTSNTLSAKADNAPPTVTNEAQGKVSLGELCERHDVLYAVLPGGASYITKTGDTKLQQLVNDNLIEVYDESSLSIDGNNVLQGFNHNEFPVNRANKVLVVIPKNVTSIEDGVFPLRDRTVGVAWEEGSQMTEIPAGNGTNGASKCFEQCGILRFVVCGDNITKIGNYAFWKCTDLQDVIMPNVQTIGIMSFRGCTNLYHISIPDTVTSIGKDAFYNCGSLVDVENNSSAVSNDAFPYAMNIYTSENRSSYLRVYDNFENNKEGDDWSVDGHGTTSSPYEGVAAERREALQNRSLNKSLVFNYNNSLSGTLATLRSGTVNYQNKWYFVAFDGLSLGDFGWNQTTEYYLPEQLQLNAARAHITYDYLGCDGTKYVNSFAGETEVNEYDINKNVGAYKVAIPRIFFPQGTVKVIGDNVFIGAQTSYVYIPASVTAIGRQAFRGSHRNSKNGSIIYFEERTSESLNVGEYAFSISGYFSYDEFPLHPGDEGRDEGDDGNAWKFDQWNSGGYSLANRKIIFANKTDYDALTNNGADFSKVNYANDVVAITYLVPVYLNEETDDGTVTKTFDGYRLHGKYLNSEDFKYTYTLNSDDKTVEFSEGFDFLKNGYEWSEKSSVSTPNIAGNTSTVWYTSREYDTKIGTDYKNTNNYLNQQLQQPIAELNLYTRKIGAPDLQDQTYKFNEDVSADKSLSFTEALKFTAANLNRYEVTTAFYTDFKNNTSSESLVQNAGTYEISVRLNSQNWGVWDNSHTYTYTVTVNRAEFDLGDIKNLPEFSTGAGLLGGTGDGTTLYQYSDGWYLYAKVDEVASYNVTVLNSYARHTGNVITVSAKSGNEKYTISASEGAVNSGTDSKDYLADFTLEIADPNYVFSEKSYRDNLETFQKLGITFTNLTSTTKNATSVNITKRWYIVSQQNWLIDISKPEGSTDPYALLTFNGEAVSTLPYEAIFGSGAYEVHIPKLAKDNVGSASVVKFTITYGNGTNITDGEKNVTELPNYINSAMPAGTFTVNIFAPAVTSAEGTLPALNDVIRLTVTPKAINSEQIIELLGNKSSEKTFEHVYLQNSVFLYDNATATALNDLLRTLNENVNTERKNASETNVWKNSSFDEYYENVKISYNLDRMQSTSYVENLSELNILKVPSEVGQYVVYYSLSARNYQTVGGANAADRRDYVFNTIIYREISTSDIADIVDMTYNGSERKPSVPYSPYYTYSFDGDDYTNSGNATVTFTITDTVLNRWSTTNVPSKVTLQKDGDDKYTGVAVVTYKINPATNSWRVAPQMPSWVFNGFDDKVNVISSLLTFTEATVTYKLRVSNQSSNTRYVGKDGSLVAATATADHLKLVVANGVSDPAEYNAFVKTLNSLKPGTYYLVSVVEDYANGNVKGFNTDSEQFAQLNIGKANNRWTETPNVIRWTWGEYNPIKNLISATSLYPMKINNEDFNYGENVPAVVYSILNTDINKTPIAGLSNFSVVDDEIAAILAKLPVGNYYLRTSLAGTDYYSAIEATDLLFDVSKSNNYWDTTPRLSTFKYTQFVVTSNFTAGVPHYPVDNKAVQYGIFSKDIANAAAFAAETSGYKFTAIDGDVADYLNGLGAGIYYFVAYVPSDSNENFAELFLCNEFSIVQAANAWDPEPNIKDWVYGEFAESLVTRGVAEFGTVQYTVQKRSGGEYVDYNGYVNLPYDSDDEAVNTLLKVLNTLGYGSYKLIAKTETSDNYAQASKELYFAIDKADNAWTDNTPPTIDGWTYNSTPKAHTDATAVVNTGDIDYKYYPATLVRGEWVPNGDAISLSTSTDAGNYVMVATVPGNDNYNELVHTVHFAVSQRANNWTTEPEDRLDWTWGATSIVDGSRLVIAAATEGNVFYTIFKVAANNTSTAVTLPDNSEINSTNIKGVLKTLGEGNYRVTTTVAATTNYIELSKVTTVTVSNATLTVTTEPSSDGWTWGAADSAKQFTNIVVSTVLETDKATITYTIGSDSYNDYDIMLSALKGSNAGTYTVNITAACDNYVSVTRSVTFEIGNADFIWDTRPTDASWTWDSTSNDGKTLVEPKAHDLSNNQVVFTYTRTDGDAVHTYTFTSLKEFLLNAPVSNYTINVAYERANYNSINESFTVTVSQATNEWTANTPQASYECEYTNKESINVLQAAAKFGTVVYQNAAGKQLMNGSTAITTAALLNSWIHELGANDTTPYVFYTVVVGTSNYQGLSVKTEVLITGTKSNWQNKDYIKDSVNLTFSDSLNSKLDTELDNAIPYGDNAKGKTTYTISYNSGNEIEIIGGVSAVMDWIKGINVPDNQKHSAAGTYLIKSTFVPEDKSYTTLNHTLTLVIARAKPQWDTTLVSNYYGQYGSIEVPTITVKGYSAPVTVRLENLSNSEVTIVTVKDGAVTAINGNEVNALDRVTFAEYVKTLNAVTTYYAVSYSVESTNNYEGLNEGPEAKTSRLYISPIVNAWLANTEANITAEDWVNGHTWTFTRGSEEGIAIVIPTAIAGNDTIKITLVDNGTRYPLDITVPNGKTLEEALNSYLNNEGKRPAGTYTLTFTIPQTDNYNGLVSNCQLVINKKANTWTTNFPKTNPDDANYNFVGNGTIDTDTFTTPEADNHNELVRFNIVKSNGTIVGRELTLGAVDRPNTFLYELALLANGTYTVTAYIGGNTGYTDADVQTALKAYNDDYEAITTTCVITLTPYENNWTTQLSGQTWTYREFDKNALTQPVAERGNDAIVYTLRKGDTILKTFTVEDYGNNLWNEFTKYLADLGAGTYSASVSIEGTNIYYAPTTLTAVFVVDKVVTTWNMTNTELAAYEHISGAWNAFDGTELPNLAVANWDGAKIVYSVNGEPLEDNASTPAINEGHWTYALANLSKSGIYTFKATVEGDDNHTALSYSVNVVASLATNSWTQHMNTENKEDFTITWTYKATTGNQEIVYVAAHGDVEFTVNGGKVADLAAALAALSAGEHAIVASVPATTGYSALSETIKLQIKKAPNSWDKDLEIKDWEWNDANTTIDDFTAPVPAQGSTAIVTVRNASNDIVLEATLSYSVDDTTKVKSVNENDYNALVRKLCALDVGSYTISIAVNESENYLALTTGAVEFKITQATNVWTASGAPTIAGWDFGGSTAYPSATPQFGKNTVVFSYAEWKETHVYDEETGELTGVNESEWSAAPNYTAGAYWLRAYVPGTANYTELYGYHKFNINEAKNEWVKMPGVVAWSWNGYDKDINLFSGSARSNKPAAFTITKTDNSDLLVSDFNVFGGKIVLDDGTEIVINNASIQSIRTALTKFTLDGSGKVSEKVAKILNALVPGSYRLTVKVDGGESLDAISGYTDFTVSKANNEWTTAPNVLSYDYNGYVVSGDRASFTAGVSKYGAVSYAVRSGNKYLDLDGNGNVTQSDSSITLNATKVAALLPKLGAGNYALQAWVSADAGATYNPFAADSHYSVLFGVSRIENGWTTATQNSVEEYYADLHAQDENGNYTFAFTTWFTERQTTHQDKVNYTVLDTNYNTVKAACEYNKLFETIRSLDPGSYIIRMTVVESDNYFALAADTSLTIKRYANSFTEFPTSNLSGQWQLNDEGVNATTLDAFTVTAAYGNNSITYTINGVTCTTATEFDNEVAKLNAGPYQVTVEVKQTNDYAGLTRTIQLDVQQGSNDFTVAVDDEWTWHDASNHLVVKDLKYGSQVYVAIAKEKSDSALSYITIDFTVENPLSVLNQIINGTIGEDGKIVGGLDAGAYSVTVTARASSNWSEVNKTATFTINKTNNEWTSEPALNGTLNAETNVYSYGYGNAITPSASAQHGTAKYTYYVNDADYADGNAKALNDAPVNVGKYVVEVSVDENTNYNGIAATKLYFDIVRVSNESFIVSPAAVGWTWGSYDRTVHMFTGIPRSGGNVSFSILDENKAIVYIDGIALDKMLLVGLTENGEQHYNDFDKDMYLESKFAPLIAKLVEGNYYVQINVDETTNNNAFTATAPFKVVMAENGWKVTPKIASWSLGLWAADKNSPQAEPRFGTAHIVVTSQNNNEVFYDNNDLVYNEETGEYEILNRLGKALAGWYKMTVTVEALQGCYTGLDETVNVQVYMRGSNETKNYWYETFGINSWEAIVGGIGNEPYGTPLRGLPYFEFYYAKGEGANAVIDWDRPVVAGEDSYLVKKGDNKYYKDFYVPMAPGYYFMVACAVNVDSEGNVIEADSLRETERTYTLHIENRANTFTDDPRIDTLLFLGERGQWAEPTAAAFLADSEIWFTYQNAETGMDLGKNKPTLEGKYIVIAHAKAKYSEEITKEAKFTVELSTNEWIEQPTIEGWSEEFADNIPEPVAEAKCGTDNIVYTFENLDTGEILKEKPTTEGTYKMTATVKLEGYRDLVGTATFTIEPAYDIDLILIDIVLGCVACALAIFVIIFAIRRYKEN